MLALLLVGLIVLLVFWKKFLADALFAFVHTMKDKKVLHEIVDGIRRAVKRFAGAFGRKNECSRRIHYRLLRKNRGLSPIVCEAPIVPIVAKAFLARGIFSTACFVVALCLIGLAQAETFTGLTGGQCVNYARVQTGNSYSTSPALGVGPADGAYEIYDDWNYGYGKGSTPAVGALLVLANTTLPVGHVGIVRSVSDLGGGIYDLRVDESNWYSGANYEKITTNVWYRFDRNGMTVRREFTALANRVGTVSSALGDTSYAARGFVYTRVSGTTGTLPDLTASAIVGSNFTAGQKSAQAQVTVARSGGPLNTPGSSYVYARLYWTSSSTASTSSTILWTSNGSTPDFPYSTLNNIGSKTVTATFDIPNVSAGTYYIIAYADANYWDTESNENNNYTRYQVTVTGAGALPDLTVAATVASSYQTGQSGVQIPVTVFRTGGSLGAQGGTYVYARLYWSTNSTWDASDTVLWSSNGSTPDFPYSTLNSVGSKTVNATINIPSVSAGTYYLIAYADANNWDVESNESNNWTAYSVNIVAPGLLPAPVLSTPSNGATGVLTTPTFSWSSVSGASRYWLMVATSSSAFPTDPNATTCPSCVISGNTSTTSHTLPASFPNGGTTGTLNPGTNYYWKVQGYSLSPTVQGQYSATGTFTTVATPTYNLNVNSSGATGVVISSNSGHGGTTNYSKTGLASGSSVQLTAPASSGSTNFSYWSGCDSSPGTSCTVSMTAAKSVTAYYTAQTYTLSVNSSGATGVAISSSTGHGGVTNYSKTGLASGTTVQLSAPASSGSTNFSYWSGCDSSPGTGCTVSMTAAKSVTAYYTAQNTSGCSQYSSYFEEASTTYKIPSNLLRAIAETESGDTCSQGATNSIDGGCGVMQLTGDTKTNAAQFLSVTEAALCENTPAGARLNILGGASVLRSKKCWSNIDVSTDADFSKCVQGTGFTFSQDQQRKLESTIETWWWPVVAYNGGGLDTSLMTSNYPFRVWSKFGALGLTPSYPPLSDIRYLVNGSPLPDKPTMLTAFRTSEIQSGDDLLYPPVSLLAPGSSGGIRWVRGIFDPFVDVVAHNNDGSVYSATVSPPSSEVSSLTATTQQASWVYYQSNTSPQWYISDSSGATYLLSGADGYSGELVWGTIANGNPVATVDYMGKTVYIAPSTSAQTSASSYPGVTVAGGRNVNVTSSRGYTAAQQLDGQTLSPAWYFFQVQSTGTWYIVNLNGATTEVYRLGLKPDNSDYDWMQISDSSWTRSFSGSASSMNITLTGR